MVWRGVWRGCITRQGSEGAVGEIGDLFVQLSGRRSRRRGSRHGQSWAMRWESVITGALMVHSTHRPRDQRQRRQSDQSLRPATPGSARSAGASVRSRLSDSDRERSGGAAASVSVVATPESVAFREWFQPPAPSCSTSGATGASRRRRDRRVTLPLGRVTAAGGREHRLRQSLPVGARGGLAPFRSRNRRVMRRGVDR
jgi:hypothetical protein